MIKDAYAVIIDKVENVGIGSPRVEVETSTKSWRALKEERHLGRCVTAVVLKLGDQIRKVGRRELTNTIIDTFGGPCILHRDRICLPRIAQ
jgi:hypothetical protein